MEQGEGILKSMHGHKPFKLFLLLAGFFIANTLVAEFVGVKIFSFERTIGIDPFSFSFFGQDNLGFELTAGVVLWPVVFIMTDVINEYFGMKSVRILSYMAIGLIIYAFVMIYFAIGLSPSEWWQFQSGLLDEDPVKHVVDMNLSFNKIMGQGLWIIIGSMVAFLIGQIVDVAIFHRIKKWTGERLVWLRATGSTFVSQFIDSYVVLIIAFYYGADWELSRVFAIGTVNLIYKFVVAVLLTPTIYLAHAMIDNYLGKEVSNAMKAEAAA
ncbi:MAG: queuosine precursor transporter [Bacteroidota bacterium]